MHRQSRAERIAARLYARFGSRVWYVSLLFGIALGLVCLVITMVVGARFLNVPISDGVSLYVLWAPITLATVPPAMLTVRRQVRVILSWSAASDKPLRAAATWSELVRNKRIVIRGAVFVGLVIPPAAIDIAIRFHKPWWSVFPFTIAFAVALASVAALVVAIADLMLRPMLEEVVSFLPEGFEPATTGARLRRKALVPLPLVTGFAAVLVGAYGNTSTNSAVRLTIALAATFATVAVATIVFSIVNRSILSPIDDLIAATRRVRAGDVRTPVPVVTDDELGTLAAGFNQMLAELRRHTEELRASRERIVTAGTAERRRVERNLHDGAQQLLVLAQLKLGLAERAIETDASAAKATIAELRQDMARALSELRDLARGIYPALLESDGLRAALGEAIERASIPAQLYCDRAGRYGLELEAAVYFCCLEALQNAAKHAGPDAHVEVHLGNGDGVLRFEIRDDGCGFEHPPAGEAGGLQNMVDRIGALGGELLIESGPGRGTSILGAVPVPS